MRRIALVFCVVLLCVFSAAAQDLASTSLKNGSFEFGIWAGGGTGIGAATPWQFFNTGVRLGKVLTDEIGSGPLRGNFEFAADSMPVYLVFQDQTRVVNVPGQNTVFFVKTGKRETVYGTAFNPVVLKWNFTRGKKIAPFFEADGGLLITRKDVPFPDTSNVNFMPGGGFGFQYFRDEKHAITFSGHVIHISNASLGDHNPGINATLQFRIGYHWYR
jgi:hypothetical protein